MTFFPRFLLLLLCFIESDAASEVFRHFVAHSENQTCTADEHARPFNNQIRGVNLGGWMVLEPWITPSLFYQFLGGNETTTAFDMYTFCQVLGPSEANRQLRRHWETWVTEDIIQQLVDSGAVNSLRLPIGDFQFIPYGPYTTGCVDGGLDYVDQLLDWAYERGLNVLLDIHTMKDSQNGFDNSGQALGFQWTSALSSEFAGFLTFEHWPIRSANWMGDFDPKTATYSTINQENIRHALRVIEAVVDRYAEHPAVLGLEPLNEPWQYSPMDELRKFYWEGYLITKRRAPYWKYIMHDSFRLTEWAGFMDGCPERALDTHIYQAWRDPDSRIGFYQDACRQKSVLAKVENEFGPVIVGEWSLATDNCAMWLNGFNDDPYMGPDQPGTPVDPAKPMQGPYGTGMSGPIFGLCPGSRDWIRESSGNPITGKDWIKAPPEAPRHLDDTDDVMTQLALKKIDAFSGIGHGFFFWNFRTDLVEPQWSYMAALERGWIPRGDLRSSTRLACQREDEGEYKCILKKGQLDTNVRNAVLYILNVRNITDAGSLEKVRSMEGDTLDELANELMGDFFDDYRHTGVTCDFGGIAMLLERNRTLTDDDAYFFTDDEYFATTTTTTIIRRGPSVSVLIAAGVTIAVVAGLAGFVLAMRTNPDFNRRVRSTAVFMPLTTSSNSLVRQSLALPQLGDEYEELVKTDE